MKTKTILTYGAIAVGAYLGYTMLFKKKSDANFANASGGSLLGSPLGAVPAWVMKLKNYFFQKYSNYPKITLEKCFNDLMSRVKNWRLFYTQPMDLQQMESFFEDCLKSRPLKTMTSNIKIGSPIGR